jgi:hypothetical protein
LGSYESSTAATSETCGKSAEVEKGSVVSEAAPVDAAPEPVAPPPAVLATVAEPAWVPVVIVVVVVPDTVDADVVATVAGTGVGPASPAVAEAAVDEIRMYGSGVTTGATPEVSVAVPPAVVVTGTSVVVVDAVDVVAAAVAAGEAEVDDERYASAFGVAALEALVPLPPEDPPEPSDELDAPLVEMLPPPPEAAAAEVDDVPALASDSA